MEVNGGMDNCNGNGKGNGEVSQCFKNGEANDGLASCGIDAGEGSSGGSEGMQTYKRRKQVKGSLNDKALEDGRPFQEAASHLADQTVNESLGIYINNNSREHSNFPKTDFHNIMNGSDSHRRGRDFLLNCIYQSLGANKGGIEGCIQDALVFQQEVDNRPVQLPNGSATMAKGNMDTLSDGSIFGQNQHSVTDLCRRALYDVMISEKFSLICQLIFENFKGCEVHRLFDLNLINSRIREGAYEGSPVQFSSDVQQVWKKLQDIGSELTSLAKHLSDVSRTSCHAQFRAAELYPGAKPEQMDACGVHGICACKCCGQKADGRDCLVCDACEEMYHVSCIHPVLKEIPPYWYCARCITSGMRSAHDDCDVCDKLSVPRTIIGDTTTSEGTVNEYEENSNSGTEELHPLNECNNEPLCKICGNEVEVTEIFRRCGHPYCPNEYYHARCLTPKQLKTYCSRWYCPSCLCRTCLLDREDDKIILCDGCDHAYHMYCTEPQLSKIPEGKWFCRKCDEGIKKIHREKRAYERYEKKINGEGESFGKKEDDRGKGGVDMLLSAAKKLNYEENIAAVKT